MQKRAQEMPAGALVTLRTVVAIFMVAKAQVLGPTRDARGSLQRTLNMEIGLSRPSRSDERVQQLDE